MKIIILLTNNNLYRCVYLFLVVLFYVDFLASQSQQVELNISNDKIVFIDYYYTSGIHLTYRKSLDQSFIFSKHDGNALQLNTALGSEIYTPKNLLSFNNKDFDRPYAGWLFFNFEIGNIKQKSVFFVAFDLGITGDKSLAGKLQTKYHEFLNIESIPTWKDQIAFKWLFNIKTRQVQEFKLNKNNSIQNKISASLGSKDIFMANEVYYFLGKFNNFKNSSRINTITSNQDNEFYGFVSAGYKYVILNALIQGGPFKNKDPFTALATHHVFNLSTGIIVKMKKNIFKFVYNYNTKETPSSISHSYGSVVYGFSF